MTALATAPRLVILGPQGAGKGTQAALLTGHLGLVHLSTGDILRDAVRNGTALGRQVDKLLADGSLVPDELVLGVVEEKLAEPEVGRRGFLLDGFPRTRAQADALLSALATRGIDVAIELDLPLELARKRLAARRVCATCGTILIDLTGADRVRCPKGDGWAERRTDDQPAAIEARLAQYELQAGPVRAAFAERDLLVTVDATGSPDDVWSRVRRAIRPYIWGQGLRVG